MRSLTIDTIEKSDNSRALTDNNRQTSSRKKSELSRKNFNLNFFHKREKLLFLSVVSSAQRQATVAGTTGLPAQSLSSIICRCVVEMLSELNFNYTLFYGLARGEGIKNLWDVLVLCDTVMLFSCKKKSEFLVSSVRWNLIVFTRDEQWLFGNSIKVKVSLRALVWIALLWFWVLRKTELWFENSYNFSSLFVGNCFISWWIISSSWHC